MAWEEYKGNAGGDQEDREPVSFKIGTSLEATVDGKGNRRPNKFGDGEEQTYFFTTKDGVKAFGTARKAVLERFDDARVQKGDRIKLDIVGAESKSTGRRYGAVTLLVDRASGEAASQKTEMPSEPALTPDVDEDIPF